MNGKTLRLLPWFAHSSWLPFSSNALFSPNTVLRSVYIWGGEVKQFQKLYNTTNNWQSWVGFHPWCHEVFVLQDWRTKLVKPDDYEPAYVPKWLDSASVQVQIQEGKHSRFWLSQLVCNSSISEFSERYGCQDKEMWFFED